MIHVVVIVPRWHTSKPEPAQAPRPLTPEDQAQLRARWVAEAEFQRQHPAPPVWLGCLTTLAVLLAIIGLIVWAVSP